MKRIAALRHWPLLAAFAWLAGTLWARPLSIPDEGRYVGVAWGMLTSGDWLVPRLDGLPYFHKPPLFYWISAAAMQAFGPVQWAVRIAPCLGALAGATAMYCFALRWCTRSEARLALLTLGTQVMVVIGAQFANLDMLVAGCITVTILAFAHAALCEGEGVGAAPRQALVLGYLFAGLGVLAKGLIGVVLPGMVIVAWLFLQRRPRTLLRLVWWPGVVLFLALTAPWFALMQHRFAGFLYYFFYVQQFARYAESGFNNQQPIYFYPVVLALLAFPWSLWMLWGARRRRSDEAPQRLALRQLLWVWLAVIVLFFSVPQSKLVGYIIPAAWPIAMLAADSYTRASSFSRRLTAWWRFSAGAAICACVAAVSVGTVRPLHSTRDIGVALRLAAPGDPVVFLQHYWFDVAFYARLRRPVAVVDTWDTEVAGEADSWHKELADAGRFDPSAGGRILIPLNQADRVLCSSSVVWVVADRAVTRNYAELSGAQEVASEGATVLWRIPPRPGSATGGQCAALPGSRPAVRWQPSSPIGERSGSHENREGPANQRLAGP